MKWTVSRGVVSAFALVLVMWLTFTLPAFGQAVSGNLTGVVFDPAGAVVNAATVDAVNLSTGQTARVTTKSNGEYLFSNLPVGTYRLSVTAPGFQTTVTENVPVELNKANTANLKLQMGTQSTTVEVSGAAPPVDTTTAQLQVNYNDQLSLDLGITSNGGVGGGVLNLSLLSPGVTNASSMGMGTGPSVGGQRPRDNNFTVEGVDNNAKTTTGALAIVPSDAVESFSLLSNQFNSEYGHSSGGQFNTIVKSGTNSFHGTVYEYFRNRNLNAVDELWVQQGLTSNPRLDNNRFGATFGGPIIKDKLFFFTDFERNPIGFISSGGGAVQAPTAAGLAAIAADPGVSATNLGIFHKFVPAATKATGCIPYAGQSNGVQISPFSAPANGSCLAGTVEVGNVSIVPPSWQSYTNYVQSVDYNISSKDQIRGRFVYNHQPFLDNAAQLGAFFVPLKNTFDLLNISEYHTFSPTITNEFRFGFNRFANLTTAGNFSYPGLDVFPNLTLFDLGNGLNIGPDPNAPQSTIQNFYGFVDNVSLTRGNHTFKFGGEYRWYISPQSFTQRSRGDYEYNETQMFLEDFSPDFFGQRSTGSTTYYGNQSAIYWYASDNWRVNHHLSLDLGVRYEYTTTPLGENRQSLNALANTPNLIVPQVNQPLVFSNPRAPKNNWAPRIGFAYSPGDSGNTSIRGGFGMAYDVLYDNIGVLQVPPQVGSTNNVDTAQNPTPNFLGGGGLSGGGGSGVTILDQATARANTSTWIPPDVKDPYSINWNLGIQHSFGKDYTAEINYVGTRGVHLNLQNILTLQSLVTPQRSLPTFLTAPSQATLNSLPLGLSTLEGGDPFATLGGAFENAGFGCSGPLNSKGTQFGAPCFPFITAFIPGGWSTYHGLETSLTRRMTDGLMFQAAYTWSHAIDNSTADFHTSDITPRRPQDFLNFGASEKANSALDRAQRFTLALVYDLPYFKNGSWLMKNVVGNWQFSPIYTYESGQWVTVQANRDANLNGDSAGDRAIINPAGQRGVGTGVTALTATAGPNAGDVVAYVANNPNAQFIQTGVGALSNLGRNTLQTPGTNNIDMAVYKNLDITERIKFRFGAQFANIINHPQFIPGSNPGFGLGVNDVSGFASVGDGYKAFVNPGNKNFNNPAAAFASNARSIALTAKFSF